MRRGFEDYGIEDILLVPPYPKIGGGKIYSGFCVRAIPTHLCTSVMLGLEPESCGDRTVRGLPGKYLPVSDFEMLSKNKILMKILSFYKLNIVILFVIFSLCHVPLLNKNFSIFTWPLSCSLRFLATDSRLLKDLLGFCFRIYYSSI